MRIVTAVALLALAVGGRARAAPLVQARTLTSGIVVADEIRAGAVHEYRIAARAGDAIDVRVTQLGIDVMLLVLDPNGVVLQDVDSPTGAEGDEKATALADGTGTYLVRLRPFEAAAAGKYEVRMLVRAATPRDRDRAEVETALRTTARLLASGVEGDAAQASRDLTRALPKALTLDEPALARSVAARLMDLDAAAVFSALDVPVLPGPVPVYYSRGREDRATALREALVKAIDHFDAALKIRPRVSLAVLADSDWERVTGAPYGMPFSHPGRAPLIVMPAEHVMFAGFLAKMAKEDGPSGVVGRAAGDTGLPLDAVTRRLGDSILYHEFGHVLVAQYAIVSPNRWLGEFLGNYVMQAFLAESGTDPRLLTFFRVFKDRQRSQPVSHRSLDDLERLYAGVGMDNYGWYQAQTDARAAEVYRTHGVAFLAKVKAAFPAGTPSTLPVAEVLSRLDAIAPGFTAWARALEEPARP